jgi:hypothetical protein
MNKMFKLFFSQLFIVLSFILLFSFFSSFVNAGSSGSYDNLFTAETAELNIKVSSNFNILPTKSSYIISNLEVKTNFYPKDTLSQSILSQDIDPIRYVTDDEQSILFTWKNPTKSQYGFVIDSDVKTNARPIQIKKTIPFPREDNLYSDYVLPTEYIDSDNPKIKSLAMQLTHDKTDYYDVVITLAEWVHKNIKYDLSTLTADTVQKASWVLDNKEGVCDEMTSLFTALLRSINIPAKYVSGVSYTNSDLFDYDFGPHGWAEVYFPDYGWVPFDVTYGEYGFVDSSHIILKESYDSGESSTYYSWTGLDVNVESDKSIPEVEVLYVGDEMESQFDISAKALKSDVGFGSYNLIQARVENKMNYYLPLFLSLSNVESMTIISDESQLKLFKPNEVKYYYWVVKVSDNLNSKFYYNFPFNIYNSRNEKFDSSFNVKGDSVVYYREDILQLKRSLEDENSKKYSENVRFYCEPLKKFFYNDESVILDCYVENSGDIALVDLFVCYKKSCSIVSVLENDNVNFNLTLDNLSIGEHELLISAKNNEISKSDSVFLDIKNYPILNITELYVPSKLSYDDNFNVEFVLDGVNNPKNIDVLLKVNNLEQNWELSTLNSQKKFIISMNSVDLYPIENDVEIILSYLDENGKIYTESKSTSIHLTNLSFFEKIVLYSKMYFDRLFY